MTEIQEKLFALQDEKYRAFQMPLIPNVPGDRFIGVRTPALRALAKELYGSQEAIAFLQELPHRYFDENQLHAFLLCQEKDYTECMAKLEIFLPFIDNWATSDQLSPHVFRKHRQELLPYIDRWLTSDHVYTVRYATGMLMQHFLDDAFDPVYMEKVAALRSGEYYVNMMTAWYFATALAKQYDAAVNVLLQGKLDDWTHNKAIQKARESRRISPEKKEYLKSLKH